MSCLVIAVLLVGCHLTQQQEAVDVCNAYCKCVEADLPGVQRTCVERDCLPQLPPVTEACLDCVFTHDRTCSDLTATCTQLCLRTAMPRFGESP